MCWGQSMLQCQACALDSDEFGYPQRSRRELLQPSIRLSQQQQQQQGHWGSLCTLTAPSRQKQTKLRKPLIQILTNWTTHCKSHLDFLFSIFPVLLLYCPANQGTKTTACHDWLRLVTTTTLIIFVEFEVHCKEFQPQGHFRCLLLWSECLELSLVN